MSEASRARSASLAEFCFCPLTHWGACSQFGNKCEEKVVYCQLDVDKGKLTTYLILEKLTFRALDHRHDKSFL